jgi:hypothetical protein
VRAGLGAVSEVAARRVPGAAGDQGAAVQQGANRRLD